MLMSNHTLFTVLKLYSHYLVWKFGSSTLHSQTTFTTYINGIFSSCTKGSRIWLDTTCCICYRGDVTMVCPTSSTLIGHLYTYTPLCTPCYDTFLIHSSLYGPTTEHILGTVRYHLSAPEGGEEGHVSYRGT